MAVEKRTIIFERFKELLEQKKGVYNQKTLLGREDCPLGKDLIVDIYRSRPIGVSSIEVVADWLDVSVGFLVNADSNPTNLVVSESTNQTEDPNSTESIPLIDVDLIFLGNPKDYDQQAIAWLRAELRKALVKVIAEFPSQLDTILEIVSVAPANSVRVTCRLNETAFKAIVKAFSDRDLQSLGMYRIEFLANESETGHFLTWMKQNHLESGDQASLRTTDNGENEWKIWDSRGVFVVRVAPSNDVRQDKWTISTTLSPEELSQSEKRPIPSQGLASVSNCPLLPQEAEKGESLSSLGGVTSSVDEELLTQKPIDDSSTMRTASNKRFVQGLKLSSYYIGAFMGAILFPGVGPLVGEALATSVFSDFSRQKKERPSES